MAVGASPQDKPHWRLVEIVLATYAALVSLTALTRIGLSRWNLGIALAHALVVLLMWMLTRPGLGKVGQFLREVSPLVLILVGYSALDVLSGGGLIRGHDDTVMRWEQALFGMQPARDWWRGHPSAFWSFLLHGVYLFYYLVLAVPSVYFIFRGDWPALRLFSRNVVCTYCFCFLIFAWFPVGGPYYVFARPTGAFVDNLPAQLVYAALLGGSSYGAAFPSSHVAATTAAELATWKSNRVLGMVLLVPVILMPIATVYTQMHYGIDALLGLVIGVTMPWVTRRAEPVIV
jgi:hypothetical protein